MNKLFLFILLMFVFCGETNAQQEEQSVRGMIKDAITQEPIAYATIVLVDIPSQKAVSDSLGKFNLRSIPVGRHILKCQYVGYETVVMNELLVTAGKETFVEITMTENHLELKGIEVRPTLSKQKALNNMVLTGGRMFSVEETSRFAGGFDDPARLATSFAGVASGGATNGISIHGNAPHLLAWRLEGLEIPNPNHFSDISILGGGIFSSLSALVIGNSDFLTCAFPSEYGNAVSGVFDMKMRKGNDNRYEHAVQVGIGGIDIASEGPISRKDGSSYIVNYRYSMTGLVNNLNLIDMQGQVMDYQDLNFKIYIPTSSCGQFSVWGTGYIDHFHCGDNPSEWNSKQDEAYSQSNQYMGVMGLTHLMPLKYGKLTTSLGVTINRNDLLVNTYILPDNFDFNRKDADGLEEVPFFRGKRNFTNIIFNSVYNRRLSRVWNLRTGVGYTEMLFDVDIREAYRSQQALHTICSNDGSTGLLTAFAANSVALSGRTILNFGLNVQHLLLNNSSVVEPRIGLSYKTSDKVTLALAYGLHSRAESTDIYFTRKLIDPVKTGDWNADMSGTDELVNKNLGFTKSHHLMFTFNYNMSDYWNLKIEPYAQWLFNVPVEPGTSYSVLNRFEFYLDKVLVNEGRGQNFGIDITLERYLHNGWYGMLNGSFFRSRYKGGDGIWRHSAFDRSYIINVLCGKEWMLGSKKNNMLSVNLKTTLQGGDRYSPIDVEATMAHPDYEVQYDLTKSYSLQRSPMLIIHYTLSYRINKHGKTHEFSIKHINCTGTKSFYGYEYAYRKGIFEPQTFNMSLPNISYKYEF